MILDYFENRERYSKGHEDIWQKVFAFIGSINTDKAAGTYPLQGEKIFALIQEYETIPLASGKIEAHSKYADIHLMLSGTETMYYSPVSSLELIADFRPENDDLLFGFRKELAESFILSPGRFALLFAGEGHLPCIQADSKSERVKKVVIKILNELII